MKKFFLLAALTAAGIPTVMAEVPAPVELDDAFIYALSPNGQYAVSSNSYGIKIYDLKNGQEVYEYIDETGMSMVSCGIGKCVSDNGIVLGSISDDAAQYWKDGEWYDLPIPSSVTGVCLSNAITPDASRICGSIGLNPLSLDGDALMQVPVVWNATADGYSQPVILPYPEKDFTGRVPQYVTAVDMSADGKVIVGQVTNATGMINYPIIYKEAADGTWSYEIVDEASLIPEGVSFGTYPGDGPTQPQPREFMSAEEEEEYDAAYQAWVESGYQPDLYPVATDFMTEEEVAEYEAAMEAFNEEYMVWEAAFDAWFDAFEKCLAQNPNFLFNSMRIGPDGKYFGGTVSVEEPGDDWWDVKTYIHTWIADVETMKYTKYDQQDDLNLTYLGNDGVGLASTSVNTASQSWILKHGVPQTMYYWMYSQCPEYAVYMKDNMTFGYESYDWETGESTVVEELMSGRAVSTPNLEVMALTVQNIWDYMTDGEAFIFNVAEASAVNGIEAENNGETVIYDLQGRKLNNAEAPGIYIINGEKKVVR